MKRILILCAVAVCLVLLEPTSAPTAQERTSPSQETPPSVWSVSKCKLGTFNILKLWEQKGGPQWPQIAILQLTDDQLKTLESGPLGFYDTCDIFGSTKSEYDQGHFVIRLGEFPSGAKSAVYVTVVHDVGTYSAYAAFQVANK